MLFKICPNPMQANMVADAIEFCLGDPASTMRQEFAAGTSVVGSCFNHPPQNLDPLGVCTHKILKCPSNYQGNLLQIKRIKTTHGPDHLTPRSSYQHHQLEFFFFLRRNTFIGTSKAASLQNPTNETDLPKCYQSKEHPFGNLMQWCSKQCRFRKYKISLSVRLLFQCLTTLTTSIRCFKSFRLHRGGTQATPVPNMVNCQGVCLILCVSERKCLAIRSCASNPSQPFPSAHCSLICATTVKARKQEPGTGIDSLILYVKRARSKSGFVKLKLL